MCLLSDFNIHVDDSTPWSLSPLTYSPPMLFPFSLRTAATYSSGHILIPCLICHHHPCIITITSCFPKVSSFLLVLQELQQSSNSNHPQDPSTSPTVFLFFFTVFHQTLTLSLPSLITQPKIHDQSSSFLSRVHMKLLCPTAISLYSASKTQP